MSRSENQYNFFKNVCLDDNGLLCGIQDVINGLQNITTVVSGNTEAINNIDINVIAQTPKIKNLKLYV